MLKRLFLFTLCGVLMLACAACGDTAQPDQTQSTTEVDYTISYVPNETVNRFLLTMKERTDSDIPEVSQGNAPDEYILTLNGCQVSLTPSAQGMGVVIQAGRGEGGQKMLFGAFSRIVNAADKSCTQSQMDAAIAFMKEQTSSSTSYRVCNEVKILSYLPSVKVGGTETDHRLDLVLLNYRQVQPAE